MITNDEISFRERIHAEPLDVTNRLVYADWCEERGMSNEAEHQRSRARIIELISPKSKAAILAKLDAVNGQRRARVMCLGEVLTIVNEAARDGWAADNAGTVANAYSFPAITTVVLAVRKADGTIAVDVAEAPAKATSPGRAWQELQPWNPATAACKAKMMKWADER